jgi:hypothetical protein
LANWADLKAAQRPSKSIQSTACQTEIASKLAQNLKFGQS